ncbi:MAG TPA: 2Fe-2S iron-sulfur cluster-binding protein [Gammaproteobacteria bacterium]
MPKITYIAADGSQTTVEASKGLSVMQAAVNNGIAGIVAECGGACSCATCHVHVDPDWYDRLPAPQGIEQEMLEFAVGRDETSRLSCQIKITDEVDGLIVHTPASQY